MPDMVERCWPAFRAALAASDQPPPVFVALQAIVRQEVGARLFTLMTFDAPTGLSRRIHSSHPREYPVAGVKPLSVGLWSRTVIEERKTFVANSIETIAEVFPDHELIRSLGCGSVVNLPVVFNGAVIGVANALDAPGFYTLERVERIERLAPFITIALLAALVAAPNFAPSKDDRA
jgi:GAF domain